MNIFIILPLLLFHFYFYFHFIIKMFCFVSKINKRESISSSVEKKIMLPFTFTSISIQKKLSATIEMLGTNVNVSIFLFKNYLG